jgi:hypothetical protein
MRSKHAWRTRLYAVTAVVSGVLAIATLVVRDWAEVWFGIEPDGGSGSFEGNVTLAVGIISIVLLALTVVDFRAGRRRTRGAGDPDVV